MLSNDPYCEPIINAIKNHNNVNCKSVPLHDNNKMLRTSDNKVVVPLCQRSRIIVFFGFPKNEM